MNDNSEVRRARVIAVGNQKGGVGKSTLTVHLAAALGEMGRKCLVWDLDMNRGSTLQLGIPKEMPVLGTYEVLTSTEEPLEVVVKSGDFEDIEFPENVYLIPARRNLETIEKALSEKYRFRDPRNVLVPLIASLRGEYDYIFLDTAPNLTIPTIAAYKSADYFLLSAIPEPLAVDGLSDALGDIAEIKEEGNTSLRLIGVVLSAIDGRWPRVQRELVGYVEETFDRAPDPFIRSYATRINKTTYVCDSQKNGKTLFQLYPDHKVTNQFRELAREVEERLAALEGGQSEGLNKQEGEMISNG